MTKKKKRRKLRPIVKFIIFVIILSVGAGCFYKFNYTTANSLYTSIVTIGKINLKSEKAPDYVDVKLIDKGNARSGVKIKKIKNIVIHYTGNPNTTAKNNRDFFAKEDTEVCSHFVIGLDGEIIQCVPLNEKSAASNHRNKDTISIEVCHPTEDGHFTEKAYNSVVKLSAWLLDNCGLTEKDVIRHYDITGKECPLYYVKHTDKWDTLKKDIGKELKAYSSKKQSALF